GDVARDGERAALDRQDARDDRLLVAVEVRLDDALLEPRVAMPGESAQVELGVHLVYGQSARMERALQHRHPRPVVADPQDRAATVRQRLAEVRLADDRKRGVGFAAESPEP